MSERLRHIFPVITIALLAAAGFAVPSCNTSGCTDNQNSLPLAGFYDSATGQKITIGDIEISGVGVYDSLPLYNAGTGMNSAYLPFRADSSLTAYSFHYTQEGIDSVIFNDTISFEYSSTPYFASEECGAMLQYRIRRMDYTRHLIDSVIIADSLITNSDMERIRIYFRTSSEQ